MRGHTHLVGRSHCSRLTEISWLHAEPNSLTHTTFFALASPKTTSCTTKQAIDLYNCTTVVQQKHQLKHTVKYTCNMFTIALYHKYALISQFNIILPIKNYLSQGNWLMHHHYNLGIWNISQHFVNVVIIPAELPHTLISKTSLATT